MISDTSDLPSSTPLASVRLDPEALDRLLDEMDTEAQFPATTRRRHERLKCRRAALVVSVDQNGFRSTFVVPVRNISRGGVAFLHRAMIHVGSSCYIRIRTPAGRWMETTGQIVRSRYVKRAVYEIGLRFDTEIDVSPFVETTAAPAKTGDAAPPPPASAKRPSH